MFSVDHYDDPSVLGRLPEDLKNHLVKTAADLSNKLAGLTDGEFALVLHIDGDPPQKIRKFACVDEGNTALSALSLVLNAHELPDEAVKVAAENILRCCIDFGLNPEPSLVKMAGASSPTPETNVVLLNEKMAGGLLKAQTKSRTGEKKMSLPTNSKMPDALGKARSLIRKRAYEEGVKTAALDIQVDPQSALTYFWDNQTFLDGWEKKALAEHIVANAPVGMRIPPVVEKYAASTYAPDVVEMIACRQAVCVAKDYSDAAFEKSAFDARAYRGLLNRRDSLNATEFALQLERLDKTAGLTNAPDAVYSTFGKVAKVSKELFSDGMNSINEEQLTWLATNRSDEILKQFGQYVSEELLKNPVIVFKSLPMPQKTLIARMASQLTGDSGTHAGME